MPAQCRTLKVQQAAPILRLIIYLFNSRVRSLSLDAEILFPGRPAIKGREAIKADIASLPRHRKFRRELRTGIGLQDEGDAPEVRIWTRR